MNKLMLPLKDWTRVNQFIPFLRKETMISRAVSEIRICFIALVFANKECAFVQLVPNIEH